MDENMRRRDGCVFVSNLLHEPVPPNVGNLYLYMFEGLLIQMAGNFSG